MASEQVGVTAPSFGTNLSGTAPIAATAPMITQPESGSPITHSLKKPRLDRNLTSSNTDAGFATLPKPSSPRFKGSFPPAFSPAPLTGAAALAEERRKGEARNLAPAMSENPGHKAIASLMAGGGTGMSKAQDAPVATTTMSEGMATAANAIAIPSSLKVSEKAETSPASVTSLASLGSTAQTATAGSTVVVSPARMMIGAIEAEARDARSGIPSQSQVPLEEHASNRTLSYPGNALAQAQSRIPPRGMSLPMPGQPLAPRSPSQKKHRCPYCETEFTRHHNLKSHLLTHSQEKPYVCQTCQMRFRRLHDLKRHMKLHTGERPHICPKCDRKFARGDALARHSKGQGGCAGRRASMGSFGGDDDFEGSNAGDGDDGGMEGIMYTNGTPHPNENEMSEDDRRRFSLPSIKAQHVANPGGGDSYAVHSRTPSTYPPAGPRPGQPPGGGGLYPPNADRGGSSISGTSPSNQNSVVGGHTPTTTSTSSMPLAAGGGIFSQGGMTESPKPLSPAGMHSHQLGHDPSAITRQRSPSLATQFQQQNFGRRQSGRASPPGMSLPSPHSQTHMSKLPPLPGLAPPDQRFTLPSQSHPSSMNGTQNGQHGQSSYGVTSPGGILQAHAVPGSGRGGHGTANHRASGSVGSDSGSNIFAGGEKAMFAYVQQLEERNKHLTEHNSSLEHQLKSQGDMIKQLQEQLLSLNRNQLASQNPSQIPSLQGHS